MLAVHIQRKSGSCYPWLVRAHNKEALYLKFDGQNFTVGPHMNAWIIQTDGQELSFQLNHSKCTLHVTVVQMGLGRGIKLTIANMCTCYYIYLQLSPNSILSNSQQHRVHTGACMHDYGCAFMMGAFKHTNILE